MDPHPNPKLNPPPLLHPFSTVHSSNIQGLVFKTGKDAIRARAQRTNHSTAFVCCSRSPPLFKTLLFVSLDSPSPSPPLLFLFLVSIYSKTLNLTFGILPPMASADVAVPAQEEPVVDPAPAEPAAEEPAAAAAEPAKEPKAKKPRKPKAAASHPSYLEMITDAITSLKEKTGSSQIAIAKFVEEKHKALPPNFKKQLLVQLKKLTAAGKLKKIKGSWKLPSASPPKPAAAAKRKATPAAAKPKAKPKAKAAAAKPKAKPAAAVAKPKPKPRPAKAAKTSAKATPSKKAAAKSRKVAPLKKAPAPPAKKSAPPAKKAAPPAKKSAPAAKKAAAPAKKAPAAAKKAAAPAKKAAAPSRKAPARKAKK